MKKRQEMGGKASLLTKKQKENISQNSFTLYLKIDFHPRSVYHGKKETCEINVIQKLGPEYNIKAKN